MATKTTKKTPAVESAAKKTAASKTVPTKTTPSKTVPATPTITRKTTRPVEAPMIIRRVPEPSHQDIARRAYQLFEARGHQHGHDIEDWLRAERELRAHM